jgi:sigma-B regulation protein RsbU (phosphoserine phosphatase)
MAPPVGESATPQPAGPEPIGATLSITDFLTDGSLSALCGELGRLAGVGVRLEDAQGRVVVRGEGNGRGEWRVLEPGAGAFEAVVRKPLLLDGVEIGALVLGGGEPRLDGGARATLERALDLLARTAGELCAHELELRARLKEVGAVYKVSSLLARAVGAERVLGVALESVLDAMGLDAGAIMLLKEDAEGERLAPEASDSETDVVLAASRNLSPEWINDPRPLSRGRLFDRLALQGQVVVSEDVARDERILLREEAAREGLGAAIHAGLVFQDRPIGLIRLYSREPRSFTEEDKRLLRSIAQQAAVAVEQSRLLTLEREEQRVQRQLQLAADVQRRMLPRGAPQFPHLDVAARYQPSFELGGDFYDFVDLHGHLGVVIGDVVGKGVAAALLMSAVRASLRAHVQGVYDLDEVVSRVNKALCRDTRDHEFASLWYGVIDPASLRLTYCSAGHEPTIVIHMPSHGGPTPADITELNVGGMVVGIDPSQRYQRAVFDLQPGDVILAYTDGVTDSTNFAGERFGKKRLRAAALKALGENPRMTSAELIERISWEVRQFAGLNPQPDDYTTVVVRVRSRQ